MTKYNSIVVSKFDIWLDDFAGDLLNDRLTANQLRDLVTISEKTGVMAEELAKALNKQEAEEIL